MSAKRRTRYYFFLNPYVDAAFTRCPHCDGKTKQRKLPLVVHLEPHTFCVLNKTCRFCPACELVIARQTELESMLVAIRGQERTLAASSGERPALSAGSGQKRMLAGDGGRKRDEIGAKDYLVIGTLDRADWRAAQAAAWSPSEALEQTWLFKDHRNFRVTGGWRPAGNPTVG